LTTIKEEVLIRHFAFFRFQLCEERMCQEEVSILAINYMDRVLNKLPISKNNLQLLAATCTFLASKLREPSSHALQPEVLIYYTDNSITKRDLMVSEAIYTHDV
jgi:G1/S-specific cyclin-D2